MVYLDNAASTPILPEVIEVMEKVMYKEYGNPSSIHKPGREGRTKVEDARKQVANQFGCSIGEIFFTGSATESNNTVLLSAAMNGRIKNIISSPTEHPCVLNTIKYIEDKNWAQCHWLDVDEKGYLDLGQLEDILKNNSDCLVSVMYANNETGLVQDVRSIGEMAKAHGALFHCDAVQAAGHFQFELKPEHFDYVSMSAHKFHGPKGTGVLFMSGDSILPPLIRGGAQERNMRAGTESTHGIAGLAKALELSYQNLNNWRSHITRLRNKMMNGLGALRDDFKFYGDPGDNDLYTVLNVGLPDHPKSEMLVMLLDMEEICASGGSACSSGSQQGSHVIRALNHGEDRPSVRFSFSHLNTEEEIDFTLEKMKKIYE
jgi:cysteine desulfurase